MNSIYSRKDRVLDTYIVNVSGGMSEKKYVMRR